MKKDKLVMIGDSITDSDRKRPVGEGLSHGTGRGYVALIEGMLNCVYPERLIRVVNMGVSGNTVRDLKVRWTTDVIGLKPDWLSIMIGTNDVWRHYDQPTVTESHVYLDEYEATLRELISTTKLKTKGIILMTPFYIEPNRDDPMRRTMDQYGQLIQSLSKEYDTLFVDTQAAFDLVLKEIYPATLAWDRVHPNMTGHATLARAFLKAVDFVF